MEEIYSWLENLVSHLGYLGIFILTTVESTFVPLPAEFTVIPAGSLAAKGQLNYLLVLAASTLGVIAGSAINYWLGFQYGRRFILRYGKYIFIKPSFLKKTELFFAKHGGLAVLLGRILPAVKHYIAFVAGIAQMNKHKFFIYTTIGGVIWMWLLVHIGYMAEKTAAKGGSPVESIETVAISITVVTLLALFVKNKMMKH